MVAGLPRQSQDTTPKSATTPKFQHLFSKLNFDVRGEADFAPRQDAALHAKVMSGITLAWSERLWHGPRQNPYDAYAAYVAYAAYAAYAAYTAYAAYVAYIAY